jgi:hypothetical protein
MKDQLLNEHLNSVTESLKSREKQLKESKGNHREIGWYIDAISSAKRRIEDLESEMDGVVTARDEVALRLIPMIAKTDDIESLDWWRAAIEEAFQAADVFLEVRHQKFAQEFMG